MWLSAAEVTLFSAEKDPLVLSKQKGLLEWMETVTVRCEDVADEVENIMVKNA
jgi:uncharacterized protein Yka (UPF0111/DUF47 family)